MDEQVPIKKRLLAVLDYDGIPERKRSAHLATACGCSLTTARKMLKEEQASERRLNSWVLDLARGLDIDVLWLWNGSFERPHPRTFRIQIQVVKRYPKEDTDQIMRLLVASLAGHRKATNLLNLVNTRQMTLHGASRLL